MKTEYQVVHENNISDFVDKVNEEIEKGWEPIGGVTVKNLFYQAMIKYDYGAEILNEKSPFDVDNPFTLI